MLRTARVKVAIQQILIHLFKKNNSQLQISLCIRFVDVLNKSFYQKNQNQLLLSDAPAWRESGSVASWQNQKKLSSSCSMQRGPKLKRNEYFFSDLRERVSFSFSFNSEAVPVYDAFHMQLGHHFFSNRTLWY